jgi:hypothetical protein
MMEAASTSETSVNFYQTTRRYNPEVSHLHTRLRENLTWRLHWIIMYEFGLLSAISHCLIWVAVTSGCRSSTCLVSVTWTPDWRWSHCMHLAITQQSDGRIGRSRAKRLGCVTWPNGQEQEGPEVLDCGNDARCWTATVSGHSDLCACYRVHKMQRNIFTKASDVTLSQQFKNTGFWEAYSRSADRDIFIFMAIVGLSTEAHRSRVRSYFFKNPF